MPINPNIALGIQQPQAPDLIGSMGQVMTLKSLMQQNELRAQQMRREQEASWDNERAAAVFDIANRPASERAAAWNMHWNSLKARNVPMDGVPDQYPGDAALPAYLAKAQQFREQAQGVAGRFRDEGIENEMPQVDQRWLAQGGHPTIAMMRGGRLSPAGQAYAPPSVGVPGMDGVEVKPLAPPMQLVPEDGPASVQAQPTTVRGGMSAEEDPEYWQMRIDYARSRGGSKELLAQLESRRQEAFKRSQENIKVLPDGTIVSLSPNVAAPGGYQATSIREGEKAQQTVEVGVGGDLMQRMQWNPATGAYDKPVGKPYKQRTGVSVSVGAQEREESKTVGKGFGEKYLEIQNSAMAASKRAARVDRLNQLLEGVQTGKLTPAGKEVAGFAASLGFGVDPSLGNKEAAESLANEMALELRNPSGGAGMPGAMSDADRQYLQRMTPGLFMSPSGRKMVTQTIKAIAKRENEIAKMARQYRVKNGSIDEGFYDILADYSDKNPMFKDAAPLETKMPNPGRVIDFKDLPDGR